jgi:alpha/beta hydrolase fold
MRRWMAAPFLFAALAALAAQGELPAQDDGKPVEENFPTADGVRLKGLFHKSAKPATGNPVVILLYEPGIGNTLDKPGDWAGLTKTLNDKGFHVFRFDWRGHGKSKDITDPNEFWFNNFTGPWNKKYVKGGNKKPIKNDIDIKTDVGTSLTKYMPVFVNDIAAARAHLDGKNDQGDLSTSSIYVIGAGDAAALGLFWMTAEWARPAIHPLLGGGQIYKFVPQPGIIVDPEAGRDIAGAVWLSGSRNAFPEAVVKNWAKNTSKLRDNNPMLLMFGSEDTPAKTQAKFFYENVLVAKGDKQLGIKPLEQTFLSEVKGKVKGSALLGNNATLGTEDTIMKYLEARQKDRAAIVRRERKFPAPYYIDLGTFGNRP